MTNFEIHIFANINIPKKSGMLQRASCRGGLSSSEEMAGGEEMVGGERKAPGVGACREEERASRGHGVTVSGRAAAPQGGVPH
jgi:hypothetical protein